MTDVFTAEHVLEYPGGYTRSTGPVIGRFLTGLRAGRIAIDIPTPFRDFEDYWKPFLGGQGPAPSYLRCLDEPARERLRATLKEKNILTNPQLTLVVKQYASKKVSVIGQVNKPGSVPWVDGMRLFDVISQSGGFTSIAEGLTPIARWGEPEDVGRAIACLASGELSFVTGDAVHVDGGLHIHKL